MQQQGLVLNSGAYVYALNQPTNAIDPDGNLVIFINGFYTDGSGAKPQYWRTSSYVPIGPAPYDDYHNQRYQYIHYEFDEAVMNHLKDHNPLYLDGSGGMSGIWTEHNLNSEARSDNGEKQGKIDAASIIANLARDKNHNIVESIKVIAHSMGAAYAKGYIKALLDYAKQHNIVGVTIAFEADFAPYQPDEQKALKRKGMGATLQYSHSDDGTAGNDPMEGAVQMDTSKDKDQKHDIASFTIADVLSLPVGNYKVVNGKIVTK